jgi:valyl-tRNA synthetase
MTSSGPSTPPPPGHEQPHTLPPVYTPADHEARIRARWDSAGVFHPDPKRVLSGNAQPYCVLIPPPNVTAALHLGHALNNTLQDILVRAHRMRGHETLWMVGTDHAGIATQAVVEKRVWAEEKKRRSDFTREQFVAKVQAFKDEYEATITNQLKLMGCSCDWDRQRFTMDPQCARAVYEAFFRLFKDGLIYRGKRLVNWDPVLQTAVADDECFDQEIDGNFYYLRYPLVQQQAAGIGDRAAAETGAHAPDSWVAVTWSQLRDRGWNQPEDADHPADAPAWITVATTRPETYFGDTAVAINPHDPRAGVLQGLSVRLPLIGRVIPIVHDSYVVLPERFARSDEERNDPKAKMATGFLKVTPAHDPNDWEIGQRHKLPVINVFAPDATISDKHGWSHAHELKGAQDFLGKTREEARKQVVIAFKGLGLHEATKPYRHSVKHSDRSKAVVEPYLSDQWYVKVTDPCMAPAANEALATQSLAFTPERYAKTYQQWHEGIRDWCISRQLWWGHQVPVWAFELPETSDVQRHLSMTGDFIWSCVPGAYEGALYAQHDPIASVLYVCARTESAQRALDAMIVEHASSHPTRSAMGMSFKSITRDPDVLDTWFSSALWPLSTMGWPDDTELLRAFNPTSVLCTAREIITLWVSRMVMFNRYLHGEGRGRGPVPFHDVFIHAVIQDGNGQKMSKSLGNGVDPLDIIASHGGDALRFTLAHMATQTQDVRLPVDLICPHTGEVFPPKIVTNAVGLKVHAPIQTSPADPSKKMVSTYGLVSGEAKPTPEMPLARNTSSKFDLGKRLCNKLWNASRLALAKLPAGQSRGPAINLDALSTVDRWMLSRLEATIARVNKALAEYQFAEYAAALYDLIWRDFCDWYLEAIKPTIDKDANQQSVLAHALEVILRLAHPAMPFVTEAIAERLRAVTVAPIPGVDLPPARVDGLLCVSGWPTISPATIDREAGERFERIRTVIEAIRELRATMQVKTARRPVLHVPQALGAELQPAATLIATLAGLARLTTDPAPAGAGTAKLRLFGEDATLSDLADVSQASADISGEVAAKRLAELRKQHATITARLANPGYLERAPAKLVEESRSQLQTIELEIAALQSGA